MSDIAIRVENLGKQYRIGGKQERYKRFTETAMDVLTAPVRRLRNLGKPAPEDETIWALRDVSFEIKRGEAVGIIGRNGAGKSTLLKILSRITEPSTGRVELHGRVSSLLEVGTGFHPELTGRENIYLNGTILGMRRAEIDAKFDDIVDFSGVAKFLDTPVKRYSSGMQVRLAFSVAAHLEPEILLVDEVLAVGDAEFQKKCLGKMGEVTRGGRTVLFVSHNMGAVTELCTSALHVDSGRIADEGLVDRIVSAYLRSSAAMGRATFTSERKKRGPISPCRFVYAETKDSRGARASAFSYGEHVILEIGLQNEAPDARVIIGVGVRDAYSRQILHFNSRDTRCLFVVGKDVLRVKMGFKNILNAGDYYLTLWVGDEHLKALDYVVNCLRFTVDTSGLGTSLAQGLVIQPANWSTSP